MLICRIMSKQKKITRLFSIIRPIHMGSYNIDSLENPVFQSIFKLNLETVRLPPQT